MKRIFNLGIVLLGVIFILSACKESKNDPEIKSLVFESASYFFQKTTNEVDVYDLNFVDQNFITSKYSRITIRNRVY